MQINLNQIEPNSVGYYIVLNYYNEPIIVKYDEDGDVVDSRGYIYKPSDFKQWSTMISITE